MQYYGPFHAGVVWPMLPDVWMLPLGRTWKPHDPPSGDTIGECLENHTIEEATVLAARMAKGMKVTDGEGRDDRRPGWIQLLDEQNPLWPVSEHPDAKDERLNLSPFRASIFGRLIFDE